MDLEKLIDMFERVQEEFYWTKVSVYLNKYFNINYFYSNKLWTIVQVKLAVELNKITETEYKGVTSEDYTK